MFVLFDIVIHDPRQPDTASNLALLDMVAGHFSRIEYASGGTLPGSLIAEFAKIARDYVNGVQNSDFGTSHVELPIQSSMNVQQPPSLSAGAGGPTDMSMDMSSNVRFHRKTLSGLLFTESLLLQQLPGNNLVINSMPTSFAEFSLDGGADQLSPGALMGTDVMGIFSYFLPDLDPMFYQGLTQEYDFLQDAPANTNPQS